MKAECGNFRKKVAKYLQNTLPSGKYTLPTTLEKIPGYGLPNTKLKGRKF